MRIYILSIILSSLLACSCSGFHDEPRAVAYAPASGRTSIPWKGFKKDCEYIAVMGDVQTYVANRDYLPYFERTMNWLRYQHQCKVPIKALLFVGDLTDNNANQRQWANFCDCFRIAANVIPSVTVSGNHDYTWTRDRATSYTAISDRADCHLTQYANTRLLQQHIVDSFHPDSIDNIIFRNEIGGKRIDIIALEFGTRPEVLDWAVKHVQTHPDRRFIVLTHELLTAAGDFVTYSYAQEQFSPNGLPYSTPEEVFQKLAYPHTNVIAMVCGHNGFSRLNNTRLNAAGNPVPIVLFNLQYQANGGDGLIELWEFPKGSNTVNVKIVDTKTGTELTEEDTFFSFSYK